MVQPIDDRSEGWAGSVAFAPGTEGFAYRPGEILVAGRSGADAAARLFPRGFRSDAEPVFDEDERDEADRWYVLRGDVDALVASDELGLVGVVAQPNHVLFSHGCGCCAPHPAARWQGALAGAPVYASPVYASPVYASPVYASGLQPTGRRRSSAVACAPPPWAPAAPAGTGAASAVTIGVLDTGMAADGFRPAALDHLVPGSSGHEEVPDEDADLWVDPAAGHGTFIAGLIDLAAPGCRVVVERVLSNLGDGDEVAIARRIVALSSSVSILNLSFGGYAEAQMRVLAAAVGRAQADGAVVVASAGNDATCRPTFPASLRGVVGVGALGPTGPAPFSNYGPWVRACAPGVDVVSRFFTGFDGHAAPSSGGPDPDHLEGWATWSGTSFAAPLVAAALARDMVIGGRTAPEAVARVIDAPGLLRLPDLGTVVNVA
ncbi:MAG TPA: S8 family serine peptidase [Acidimicrobiales bacterium]|nr:S8 family serine peptidase [Acidimicrobiales bacterium]